MRKTLHCCIHPGNNTRFFLNCLCRCLSDLLGHVLATVSSAQVSELLGRGKACTVKCFQGSCSAMTVYPKHSCLPLLQTPFYHTNPGAPGGDTPWQSGGIWLNVWGLEVMTSVGVTLCQEAGSGALQVFWKIPASAAWSPWGEGE